MDAFIFVFVFVFIVLGLIFFVIYGSENQKEKDETQRQILAAMPPEEREKIILADLTRTYGAINQNLICPHCQTKGSVRVKNASIVTTTHGIGKTNTIVSVKTTTAATSTRQGNHFLCENCTIQWDV